MLACQCVCVSASLRVSVPAWKRASLFKPHCSLLLHRDEEADQGGHTVGASCGRVVDEAKGRRVHAPSGLRGAEMSVKPAGSRATRLGAHDGSGGTVTRARVLYVRV